MKSSQADPIQVDHFQGQPPWSVHIFVQRFVFSWPPPSTDFHLRIQPTVDQILESCLYYAILYKGLEHLQILVSERILEPVPHRCRGTTIYTSKYDVQLTLEQHGFELRGSAYTYTGFFHLIRTKVLRDLRLFESANVGPWMRRAGCKVMCGFKTVQRVSAPNPYVVQGSTVYSFKKINGSQFYTLFWHIVFFT